MPAAMSKAVVREPRFTLLTRLNLLRASFTVLFGDIKRRWSGPSPWTTQQHRRNGGRTVTGRRALGTERHQRHGRG
jgi:hypothetical protein